MSLTFLVPSSTIRSSTKKSIKSVVGGQERIDVLSRCLLNLARWNHRLAKEVRLIVYLSNDSEQKALIIPILNEYNSIQDEIDSTHMFLEILAKPQSFQAKYQDISFERLLRDLADESLIFYLTPDGFPIKEQNKIFSENPSLCFVLGSQHDLSTEQEETLSNIDYLPISLGENNYLTSHVITILCNNLSHLDDF